MQIKKGNIDFVDKILTCCYEHFKQQDLTLLSLMHQYEERGFLTKGQLQALFYKAEKTPNLPAGLLATLQSTISKLPTRNKKQEVITLKQEKIDTESKEMIDEILSKFPQHKAVIGLYNNFNKHHKLTTSEKLELQKIYKLMKEKGML
ncbi:MAG: hypothetical protein ACOVMM_00430 [Chitinophagaceae bacterium]